MADRLNEFVVDRDHAIYSARVLGIGNNRATFNDSINPGSLQWMEDTWFVNGVANWGNAMFVTQIVAGSGKYGWVYHVTLGWIYIAPDIYDIYNSDYWRELFNDFDGFEGSKSFLNNSSDLGLWFWSESISDKLNSSGWVYVNPSSVGVSLTGKGGTETNGLVGLWFQGVIFIESRVVPSGGYKTWIKAEDFNGNALTGWIEY